MDASKIGNLTDLDELRRVYAAAQQRHRCRLSLGTPADQAEALFQTEIAPHRQAVEDDQKVTREALAATQARLDAASQDPALPIHAPTSSPRSPPQQGASAVPNTADLSEAQPAPKPESRYAKERGKTLDKARRILETGTVVVPPCPHCVKKKLKDSSHVCIKDATISKLCRDCLVEHNVCSPKPKKGQPAP